MGQRNKRSIEEKQRQAPRKVPQRRSYEAFTYTDQATVSKESVNTEIK